MTNRKLATMALVLGLALWVAPALGWFGDCGTPPCAIGTLPTLNPPGNLNISKWDPLNSTYLHFWLNFTKGHEDPVHFDWAGLAFGLSLPLTIRLGAWVFAIIWFLYLFILYERTQDVALPLVIGILSAAVMGAFFPQEAIYPALIIFAACIVTIFIRVLKERL
jgi:hypothetical protein